jgi:hypothetical protein
MRKGAALAALLLFVSATPALAQGKGRGLGKGKGQKSGSAGGAAATAASPQAAAVPGSGLRQFGVWLDDATISPTGRGWAGLSLGYWKAPFGHQWDFPSFDAGVGVSHRMQVSFTAPFSHVSYTDGPSSRGVGDAYFAVKFGLLDPEAKGHSFGVALAPVIEVLGSGSVAEGQTRVNWALPVAFEKRFEKWRAYGSAGYFSRGAVFLGAAAEVPLSDKVTGTVNLSHSRSLEDDPLSDAQDLARSRWDLGVGAVYFLRDDLTVYGSLGRTVSQMDANASSLAVGAGVSLGFQHWTKRGN